MSRRGIKKKNLDKEKKNKKKVKEDDSEISDIDLDENEVNEHQSNETNDNDDSSKQNEDEYENGNQHKIEQLYEDVDPKSRLCDLRPDKILSYLIKLGNDTLNPQLKFGALNLLKTLQGRRRRRTAYGSKRGGGYQNPGRYPGRGRSISNYPQNNYMRMGPRNNTRGPISSGGDIYQE